MTSLKLSIEKAQAHIVALCETKLSEKAHGLVEETINKKEYKIFPRYTKAGKEGLIIAVKHNTFKSTLDVTQSQLKTVIAVRISTGNSNIRVILGYAL